MVSVTLGGFLIIYNCNSMTHWYVICETLSTVQCYDCARHWENTVCLLIPTVFRCRVHCTMFVVNQINKLNHFFHRLIHKFYFDFSKKISFIHFAHHFCDTSLVRKKKKVQCQNIYFRNGFNGVIISLCERN